jgi:hypothetical protein
MKKENTILWIVSIVVTFLVIYIANLFNRDYPITGTFGIEGQKISYRFEKIHYGREDVNILIRSDVQGLSGKLFWKPDQDSIWLSTDMTKSDLALSGSFPSLKANHKLKYFLQLYFKNTAYFLPNNLKVEMRFFGTIPSTISTLKFIFFNLGLLLTIRVGLEYFNLNEKIKKFEVFLVIIFLTLTALINPLYLSYKYGFINSAIPSINKLFPIKELSISVLWIISIIMTFNLKRYKLVPLVSAAITIVLFIIFN